MSPPGDATLAELDRFGRMGRLRADRWPRLIALAEGARGLLPRLASMADRLPRPGTGTPPIDALRRIAHPTAELPYSHRQALATWAVWKRRLPTCPPATSSAISARCLPLCSKRSTTTAAGPSTA